MEQFIEHVKIAARENTLRNQHLAKQRFDQNRANPQYSVGPTVLIRNRNSTMNKFSPKFVGPYTIINRIRDKTYIVQHEGS
ncbi:unnamed protein product, partial [Rotaria magnacalcarata]